MSRILRAPVLLLALMLTLAVPVLPGHAAAATRVVSTGSARPVAGSDTALGALAAIGCGFMVRATIATGGSQVATIAGAIACCGFVLFDVVFLER